MQLIDINKEMDRSIVAILRLNSKNNLDLYVANLIETLQVENEQLKEEVEWLKKQKMI